MISQETVKGIAVDPRLFTPTYKDGRVQRAVNNRRDAIVEEPDEQETGICNSCGRELAPIYENNGYTMPNGPEHWDVVGFYDCQCRRDTL